MLLLLLLLLQSGPNALQNMFTPWHTDVCVCVWVFLLCVPGQTTMDWVSLWVCVTETIDPGCFLCLLLALLLLRCDISWVRQWCRMLLWFQTRGLWDFFSACQMWGFTALSKRLWFWTVELAQCIHLTQHCGLWKDWLAALTFSKKSYRQIHLYWKYSLVLPWICVYLKNHPPRLHLT